MNDVMGSANGITIKSPRELDLMREAGRVVAEAKAAVKEAISSVGSKIHDDDLDADLKLCWNSLRRAIKEIDKSGKSAILLSEIQDRVKAKLESEYSTVQSDIDDQAWVCLLYTSPSPRDATLSRIPSSS